MRGRLATVVVVLVVVGAGCGGSNNHNHLERAAGPTTTTEAGAVEAATTTTTSAAAAPAASGPAAPGAGRQPGTTARRPTSGGSPSGTAAPPGGPNLAAVRAHLTQIASVPQALGMAVRGADNSLYIAGKSGRVMAIRNGQVDPTPVLDLTGQVSTGGEQGLLGIVFSPDGSHLYVNYTDTAGDTHVVEYLMNGGVTNPGTRRELLFVNQPYANHNGGNLVFGPDGFLWIGLGDGGSGGDPNNNAQNPGVPLGKMLRMDAGTGQYSVWALGLRNPWRYSFDRATGSLWIGDVGQSSWEEIDFAPGVQSAGINYGWSRFEGNHVYNASRAAPNAVPPVYEYATNSGGTCAVTGGYVYRGTRIPNMNGVYLFADFCVGHIFGLANGVRDLGMVAPNLSSFGEDLNGDLYALSLNGPVYRIDPG